jgi:hypothetical protein
MDQIWIKYVYIYYVCIYISLYSICFVASLCTNHGDEQTKYGWYFMVFLGEIAAESPRVPRERTLRTQRALSPWQAWAEGPAGAAEANPCTVHSIEGGKPAWKSCYFYEL